MFHFIMSLKDDIKKEVKNIINLSDKIYDNTKYMNECKDMIKYSKNVKIDDFKFYNSLLNNSVLYYESNINIRLKKIRKDLNNYFKILDSNDYIGDIGCNEETINNMCQAYENKIEKEKSDVNAFANSRYWIKDIFYDSLESWPIHLCGLLRYHYTLLIPLSKASDIERNFF